MPSTISPTLKQTVTGAAGSLITVASTTANFRGQLGYISNSGQTSRRIKITEVVSTTTYRAKFYAYLDEDNFARESSVGAGDASYPSSVAGSVLTAYNGGTVDFPEQLRPESDTA